MGVNKEPGQRYYLSHGDLIMIAYKHGCMCLEIYLRQQIYNTLKVLSVLLINPGAILILFITGDMPNTYHYQLTDAEVSSNSDFEEIGFGPDNDFDEPLHSSHDGNNKPCMKNKSKKLVRRYKHII